MKKGFLCLLCCLVFLSGCSGITIVPRPTADIHYDESTNTLTQQKDGLEVVVKVQDLRVRPYQMINNLCSFYVAISNEGERARDISTDGFLLVDETGNQYQSISPRQVLEIISRESFYLIPYPYVGFYYLEDSVKSSQFSQFDSSLPYFPQRYPQDIYTEALRGAKVVPGGRISGLVYFVADPTRMKAFNLRLYLPGTPLSSKPDYAFPFYVEKN